MAFVPSGQQYELHHGAQTITVAEVGGGLRSYTVGDLAVLDGYAEPEMCSAGRGQILVPWPNRIRNGRYSFDGENFQLPLTEPAKGNAIHGSVRWVDWHLVDQQDDALTMQYHLYPAPGYPFGLEVGAHYRLSADGLTVTTSAVNIGNRPLPFGAGWHPYVRTGSHTINGDQLGLPAATFLTTDDQQIPVGRQAVDGTAFDFRQGRPLGDAVLDTGFTDLERDADGRAWVHLLSADGRTITRLWMDRQFGYVMIFTGDTVHPTERRRQGLAVEPMTCPPNAFASGTDLRILQPGERFDGQWGITVETR